MINSIRYEFHKQSHYFRGLFWTNLIVNVLALIFFTLVGRYENDDPSSVMTNSIGIITLAIVLSFSIAVIYSVVLYNRLLLKYYIKDSRRMMYLFPKGRTTIFLSRLIALHVNFLISFFPIIAIESTIYYFIAKEFDWLLVDSSASLWNCLLIISFGAISSLCLIVVSLLVGQLFQSTNASLITSVIIVSTIGNLVAQLYHLNVIMLGLALIILLVVSLLITRLVCQNIKKDDIIGN